MSEFKEFIFDSYAFDAESRWLTLNYSYDNKLFFCEKYEFDFELALYDSAQLDRAVQNLFFMAGVSYYKAYPSKQITINQGILDDAAAAFFARTYQRGLGEFFYVNRLDPKSNIPFMANTTKITALDDAIDEGLLIGLGGGKDSLVTTEMLRGQTKAATWSLGHSQQLAPLVTTIQLPHFTVNRSIDPVLFEHNNMGARNGHVPISAILACVGTIVGILTGYSAAVVSNENSSNEPTLIYEGVEINHQYSKSLEFETDYQHLLIDQFSSAVQYFSFLRPLSELQISELFAHDSFDKYKSVFSSCNRAFTQSSNTLSWCGECPKCAFIFLILTPFLERNELESLWGGKNLLLEPSLQPMYRKLLGIEGDKPLDCVGEIKESRTAMRYAQLKYNELEQYVFDLPDDYDFRNLAPHSMPDGYFKILKSRLPVGQPE